MSKSAHDNKRIGKALDTPPQTRHCDCNPKWELLQHGAKAFPSQKYKSSDLAPKKPCLCSFPTRQSTMYPFGCFNDGQWSSDGGYGCVSFYRCFAPLPEKVRRYREDLDPFNQNVMSVGWKPGLPQSIQQDSQFPNNELDEGSNGNYEWDDRLRQLVSYRKVCIRIF